MMMTKRWYAGAALALLLLSLIGLAWSGTADEYGHRYTQDALKRALVTFAIARGINGVISVAQGTEVAIEPAGVGVNFAPGQILDPLNDLVEWFSWVMLMAATSLGIQELLLTILSGHLFTGLLIAVAGVALALLWWRRREPLPLRGGLWRLLLLLMMVRFAVPLMALSNEALYRLYMAERYLSASAHIEAATERISEINRTTESAAQVPEDDSLLGSAKRFYQSTLSALDVRGYIDRYQQAAADVSEQVVTLIVVFVMQTVLLPLFFLWSLVQLGRWLLFRRAP